jgi:hypothetical protein
MSSIASQLASLRKQHDTALKTYDFERADLIHQQIQQLQAQVTSDHRAADRTQAELAFEHDRDLIATESAQDDRTLAAARLRMTRECRGRRQAIERLFAQEYDSLYAQHLLDLKRESSRAIPEVDALLFESRVQGKQHNYAQARDLRDQAVTLRNSINEERRHALGEVFGRNEKRLREQKARNLASLDEREKAALAELERKHGEAQTVARNRLRVKDMKTERVRKDAERPERAGSSLSAVRAGTPRRVGSVSALSATA